MENRFVPLTEKRTFPLVDVDEPELFRAQFPYSEIPRILFDGVDVPVRPADELWITDTTFRDGQQARPPYTPAQIGVLFDFLHRLGGSQGIIRQSEFFLYSKRDAQAVETCLSRGYEFPEVTGWIRADPKDLETVKRFGLKETGILTSVSDYHIFLKLKSNREKIMEDYLSMVKATLDAGIKPRCHFEDVTRADLYGFCLPFAEKLLRLMDDAKQPIKIRLCDTMGYGVTYPGATLPRSVPRLVHAFASELGYPGALLEWHGHNDFHKVHVNAATAWLYGCSSLNATLLGFGERTGNPPLEAAIIEYISLTGGANGMDTRVITEIADYFRDEIKAAISPNYPFVGSDFNVTRAGIHADGLLKNPEIYNIFDTDKILNRPLQVMITDKSGMAGIAQWINDNIPSIAAGTAAPVSKRHPGIRHINDWVAEQYVSGRTTSISSDELIALAKRFLPSLFVSDFQKVKEAAGEKARRLAKRILALEDVQNMNAEGMDRILHEIVNREPSIQLLAVTNMEGRRISQAYTQRGEKALFRNLMNKDFKEHDWFIAVVKTGEPYFSDLFFSKYTGKLVLTAALPLKDPSGTIFAIMDIDFRFDDLVKLVSTIPDEILESRSEFSPRQRSQEK